MANLKNAKKAIRQTVKKTSRNANIRKKIELATKKTLKLIKLGEEKLAQQNLQRLYKYTDKAAKNNVIHHKTAARIKARITKKVNNINKDVQTAQKTA
ncbi:30S ribosomal protein S20 [Candidatus Dojkabacteria bacterium]|nr:30S ribosomal protein S20 [Candidatus Dojkabacteria bacterium]